MQKSVEIVIKLTLSLPLTFYFILLWVIYSKISHLKDDKINQKKKKKKARKIKEEEKKLGKSIFLWKEKLFYHLIYFISDLFNFCSDFLRKNTTFIKKKGKTNKGNNYFIFLFFFKANKQR